LGILQIRYETESLEEMANIFNQFISQGKDYSDKKLQFNSKLCDSIFCDLKRFLAILKIGDQTVILSRNQKLLPENAEI
jgi:hypothetical protein